MQRASSFESRARTPPVLRRLSAMKEDFLLDVVELLAGSYLQLHCVYFFPHVLIVFVSSYMWLEVFLLVTVPLGTLFLFLGDKILVLFCYRKLQVDCQLEHVVYHPVDQG